MSSRRGELARALTGWGRAGALFACLAAVICLTPLSAASATSLPDGRAYELVSRYEEDGHEVGLNDVTAFLGLIGVPSTNGEAFDWIGLGGCCNSSSSSIEMYQSYRGLRGWQTKPITPAAKEPEPISRESIFGLVENQVPMFWTADLRRTIFATPQSYDPGDHRPLGGGGQDLYLEEPEGALTWLTQGPSGTGSEPVIASFDGASPDGNSVVFHSREQLTPNAVGGDEYMYVRNVQAGTTSLVDVDSSGTLMSPYVASLGNGSNVGGGHIPANERGSTTNAVSADGSKVFFELPAEEHGTRTTEPPHLYMRDLSNETTTPLDDSTSTGTAQYEGAAKDGSLVFFTSDEGLDGASTAKEIYEFNTTSAPIGEAPPMSAVPITEGGVVGLSAISNDGSHVFFVAEGALASNVNTAGLSAVVGKPNMYVYDTRSGETKFIATLGEGDVAAGGGELVGLVKQPDIYRPAYPTPDGSVLMFVSTGNLTGQDPAPETTLTEALAEGEQTLTVASTAGFVAGQEIQIGTGSTAQLEQVGTIDGPTELTLAESQEALHIQAHQAGEPVIQPNAQVYRYDVTGDSLICISCTPPGVPPTGSAFVGISVGGSYAPLGLSAEGGAPLSADGSRLFFESPDPLLPGVPSSGPEGEQRNLYEWENGKLSLISQPSTGSVVLEGTTPSGDDVFFASRASLAGADNLGQWMVYDARVNGGFPQVLEGSPCVAEDCRSGTESVSFSVPASALLGADLSHPLPLAGKPKLIVAKISAAQRRGLASTGHITLKASGSAAGRIVGSVFVKVKGKLRRAGRASATLKHAGNATLTLKLSSLARGVLAKRGSLMVRFEVGYSASGAPDVAEFKLVKGKSATSKRRSHA